MFSNLLSNVEGIYIYPVISLLIFFPIFIFIIYRVIKTDKNLIAKMERLPLENDSDKNIFEKNYESNT